jgi:3-oxoacyl-[acyl-carrier protein] reductase
VSDRLKGTVAIVTGGSRGIGRAIAIRLVSEGAAVAITYNSSPDRAEDVISDIESMGGRGMAMRCDVSKAADVEAFVAAAVQEFGKIDILVNNAGIANDKLIMRMTEEDWDSVIDTNLTGAFLCCREAAKSMILNHRGKIINVGSIVGVYGNPGQSNYVASKAGQMGLTKALAKELASRNIQVNTVAPGFVDTDMTATLTDSQVAAIENQGGRRIAKPEKIAGFVAFLASSESDLITGQTFIVEATRTKRDEKIHFKPRASD